MTTDTPTPETDAKQFVIQMAGGSHMVVFAQDMRNLERDRNRLLAELVDAEIMACVIRTGAIPPDREWANEEFRKTALRAVELRSLALAEAKGDATEEEVTAAAQIIADSPLIDAPKLPAPAWMGLARHILDAARSGKGGEGGRS